MFFGSEGTLAFQNDLKDCDVHLLNTGHFPLEEDLETSVSLIKLFLKGRLNYNGAKEYNVRIFYLLVSW